ncbi:hypothetical protein PENTCL1PPCAC_3993, partial [Pristionchus entomophagus]
SVLRIELPYNIGSICISGYLAVYLSLINFLWEMATTLIFFTLIGGSTAAALIAAGLEVVQPVHDTSFFSVVTVLVVLWCSPRFFFPSLSIRKSMISLMAMIPATIVTLSY